MPALLAAPARGQAAFPAAPITLIVAWPPGGSDLSMRMLAEPLARRLGQPVVVENKPGAAGAIGHRAIVQAKPDGYTIGMFSNGGIAAQYTNPNAPRLEEFEPLAFFGEEPGPLTVGAATGLGTLAQFLERAQAGPARLRLGSDPPGGSAWLTASCFEGRMRFRTQRVSYAGYAPTVTALLGGEVDCTTVPVPDVAPHHQTGKLRVLAVAGQQRHHLLPEVPTLREQGHDIIFGSWRCLVAPRGVPEERLAVLRAALLEVLQDATFQDRARQAGFGVQPDDAAATQARWQADDVVQYALLQEAGLVRVPKR